MHIGKSAMLLATTALSIGVVAASAAEAGTAKSAKPQVIKILVKDVTTSEGSEPAFIGPGGVGAKSLFTAHAGRPVVMTIVNHSKTMHTFTINSLSVNAMVVVGATVTVKFTPKKAGQLTWICIPPCGDWVMDTNGYMKGYVKVAKA